MPELGADYYKLPLAARENLREVIKADDMISNALWDLKVKGNISVESWKIYTQTIEAFVDALIDRVIRNEREDNDSEQGE